MSCAEARTPKEVRLSLWFRYHVFIGATQVNKSISLLLARSRARNDASNRAELLHASKRRRLVPDDNNVPSCARVDAKEVDRDVMMKFDVAKNEEGPLRRTMKNEAPKANGEGGDKARLVVTPPDGEDGWTKERSHAFDERITNIETHLPVRYGEVHCLSTCQKLV